MFKVEDPGRRLITTFLSIPYKMNYPCNVSGMFGILTIISHAYSIFLSKTIKGDYSGTVSGSLFNNSRINILKCDKSIPAVHAALYSLSVLY